jgi:hypothetical protein
MNTDTTPTPRTDAAIWRLTKFDSALLEHEGETLNEIHCASHDEAECLVDLLNEKERELAASEAEVERLHEDNQKLRARLKYVQGCECDNYLHPYCNKLIK